MKATYSSILPILAAAALAAPLQQVRASCDATPITFNFDITPMNTFLQFNDYLITSPQSATDASIHNITAHSSPNVLYSGFPDPMACQHCGSAMTSGLISTTQENDSFTLKSFSIGSAIGGHVRILGGNDTNTFDDFVAELVGGGEMQKVELGDKYKGLRGFKVQVMNAGDEPYSPYVLDDVVVVPEC